MFAREVWKYGTTKMGVGRYTSLLYYHGMGLDYVTQFSDTLLQVRAEEATKIINYYFGMAIYHQEINAYIKRNIMLIKGSSETGYPFEELREYYLYHLVYDKNAIDKITRDFIPDDYEEFTKGAMSKSIQGKDYGKDIDEISVLLICRQGASELKV